MKIKFIIGNKNSRNSDNHLNTEKTIFLKNDKNLKNNLIKLIKENPYSEFIGVKRPDEFLKENPTLGEYYFRSSAEGIGTTGIAGADRAESHANNLILEIKRWM